MPSLKHTVAFFPTIQQPLRIQGKKKSSHPQETHLPPQRTRAHAPLLTRITSRIRINIPPFLLLLASRIASRPSSSRGSVKGLLHRAARVPPQCSRDAVEPLGVGADDRGKRVLGGRDGDVVTLAKLDAAFSVEGAVGSRAAVARDGDAQEHSVGEYHGAEGERVWADGRKQNGGDVGVDEGAAGGEGVCC